MPISEYSEGPLKTVCDGTAELNEDFETGAPVTLLRLAGVAMARRDRRKTSSTSL